MALLKVIGLTKNFGGLCAVSNVNMEINEQELIGLIVQTPKDDAVQPAYRCL